jgi:hypothetical protein
MSDSLVLTPPRRPGPPQTSESEALFGVRSAALMGPPAPASDNPEIVVIPAEDGVVVYPPSSKLVILSEARARLRPWGSLQF